MRCRYIASALGLNKCAAPVPANSAPASSTSAPEAELPELPAEPDQALADAYSCEVLHTTQGLIKGCWGRFDAVGFYRPMPGDGKLAVRHMMILALDISSFAEKHGESVHAELLGEGSYARVFSAGDIAAKVISDRERPWVHKMAVENALEADRLRVGPRIYGHGTVEQYKGGHFKGTVLLMERLQPLSEKGGDGTQGVPGDWGESDTTALLESVRRLAEAGFFHNDMKLPNVLRRRGRPILIDFDLMSAWSIKVAVSSNCIEHSFREMFESQGEHAAALREYYDLFCFTMTLEDGVLYRRVLQRLEALWAILEARTLRTLQEHLPEDKLLEIPFEVLVRVPLQGVSVNLLDLRGNLYAHLPRPNSVDAQDDARRMALCSKLPQLLKSNGVYWP